MSFARPPRRWVLSCRDLCHLVRSTTKATLLYACLLSPGFALDPTAPVARFAQDRWGWREGLVEETVVGIRQTPDGYLWLATANGLFRFNGSRAAPLNWPAKTRPIDHGLRYLVSDASGTLLAVSLTGSVLEVRPKQKLSQGTSPPEWLLQTEATQRINIGRDFLRRLDGEFLVLQGRTISSYQVAPQGGMNLDWRIEQLPAHDASAIGPNGEIWIVTRQGVLLKASPKSSPQAKPTQLDWQEHFSPLPEAVRRMVVRRDGRLLLRTRTHLLVESGGKLHRLELPAEFGGASAYEPMLEDAHGAIWLGGRGGLLRLQGDQLQFRPLDPDLREIPVTSLFEDREGALWAGLITGDLLRWRDCPVISLGRAEGLAGEIINSVTILPPNQVWTYANDGGLSRGTIEKNSIGRWQSIPTLAGSAFYLSPDAHSGKVFYGSGPNLFSVPATATSASNTPLADPFLESHGAIYGWSQWPARKGYLVGRRSGLYYQPSLDTPSKSSRALTSQAMPQRLSLVGGVSIFSHSSDGRIWFSNGTEFGEVAAGKEWHGILSGLAANQIVHCLHWDPAAALLWIGTSSGIYTWHPDQARFGPRGLQSDFIFALQRDRQGDLWAATRNGLVRVSVSDWLQGQRRESLRLLHPDGLKSLNFGMVRGQSAGQLPDGRLLFGSMRGLAVLDPTLIRPARFAPTPVIEDLRFGEDSRAFPPTGLLPAGSTRVEVRFDAFSVSTNAAVKVEYLMEGMDRDWQDAKAERSLQYTNLRPGQYRFHLRARWPDAKAAPLVAGANETLAVWEIPPLFHETLWFRLGAAAALLAVVSFLWRRRHQLQQAQRAELEARVAERTAELEVAKQSAEQALRIKADFLATMSHELRTPMNGVLGLAELLEDSGLNSAQQELLSTLRSSGQTLLSVVDDILDLSKIESGRLEMERVPVSVPTLLPELLALLQPLAHKKGLQLTFSTTGPALPWIEGDPSRLRQVLLNLLGNAIKFTPTGQVNVHLLWGPSELQIDVQDTGIGIAPEKIAQLFENFVQGDSSTTRLYGGTGLGLAISRRLVEAMGGSIRCSSHAGQGSCFSVCLPIHAVELSPEPSAPTQALDAVLLPRRVLVAEDNLTNQRVIAGLLRKLQVDCLLVANGSEAVEACCASTFDLILMDCQMPVLDGYEATRQIHSRMGGAAPPIIALTAHALASDRANCLAAGMSGYLTKPLSLAQLRQALAEHAPLARSS